MKRETKSDGTSYWAYVLLYVDDCISIHHAGERPLRELDKFFKMKKRSIGDPDFYLGSKLKRMILPDGVVAWGMSSSKYVQEAVKNVEEHLSKRDMTLKRNTRAPFLTGYIPELDVSSVLSPSDANYYQSQVRILRWMVELGCVDIITEVSTLASHLAMPRKGHLDAVYHVFA